MKTNKTEILPQQSITRGENTALRQAHEAAIREARILGIQEYDKSKRGTKTQRVKRMAGRVMVGSAANGIIFAHNTKLLTKGAVSLLGGDTHAVIAKSGESIAPRLRQRHEARQNTEVTPSRLRRLGNFGVKKSMVAAEAITRHSSKRAAQLHEKSRRLEDNFYDKRGAGRLVGAARDYKEWRKDKERRVQEERRHAADEAASRYRAKFPEIAERERKEHEANILHDVSRSLRNRRDYIIDYFPSYIYSFAKAIPRRPSRTGERGFTGDYHEFAKSALESALTYKMEDGTVPLLGAMLEQKRLDDDQKQGQSVYEAGRTETNYIDGISTALWQLGFVQVEKESDVAAYNRGKYNPDLQLEKTSDSVIVRIPFDAENDLHRMLVDEGDGDGKMIQIGMFPRNYGHSYMNMSVVEAPVLARAAS